MRARPFSSPNSAKTSSLISVFWIHRRQLESGLMTVSSAFRTSGFPLVKTQVLKNGVLSKFSPRGWASPGFYRNETSQAGWLDPLRLDAKLDRGRRAGPSRPQAGSCPTSRQGHLTGGAVARLLKVTPTPRKTKGGKPTMILAKTFS